MYWYETSSLLLWNNCLAILATTKLNHWALRVCLLAGCLLDPAGSRTVFLPALDRAWGKGWWSLNLHLHGQNLVWAGDISSSWSSLSLLWHVFHSNKVCFWCPLTRKFHCDYLQRCEKSEKSDRGNAVILPQGTEDHQAGKWDKTWQEKQNMFLITPGCVIKDWICSPSLHNLKSIPVSGDAEHQVYWRYVADLSLLV